MNPRLNPVSIRNLFFRGFTTPPLQRRQSKTPETRSMNWKDSDDGRFYPFVMGGQSSLTLLILFVTDTFNASLHGLKPLQLRMIILLRFGEAKTSL